MQKFEFSKISKSTFNVDQTEVSRPKILQTFLNSLDKNIKFNIYSDEDFQKLSNDEMVYFDDYGNLTVCVSKDPKPWDIINIICLIDNYTIAESEIEGELKGVTYVNEIAERFLNLSYFLISNLNNINNYRDIAIELIFDLYNFGNLLKKRALCEYPQNINNISFPEISDEQEIECQKWLLGSELYEDLQKKLSKKIHYNIVNKIPTSLEDSQVYKVSILNKYFKELVSSAQKFKQIKSRKSILKNYESDYLKTPLGNIFLENLNTNIKNLSTNICKKNVSEKFYQNTFNQYCSFLGTYFNKEQEKFFQKSEFLLIKNELQESKKFNNLDLVAKVELDVIRKIQNEILNFPYRRIRSINTETLSDEILNYIVSFSLSIYIFSELGFRFTVPSIHTHTTLVFKLSNDSLHWIDLTPPVGDRYSFKVVDSLIGLKEINFKELSIIDINIMKWCHTYNYYGKRIQLYSSLFIKGTSINPQNSTEFKIKLIPADVAYKTLPLSILNNFIV